MAIAETLKKAVRGVEPPIEIPTPVANGSLADAQQFVAGLPGTASPEERNAAIVPTPINVPPPIAAALPPDVPVSPEPLPPALSAAIASGGDTQPKLAQQGPKNPLLHALARVSGVVGDQPKPGQEYEGPASGKEKGNALSNFIANLSGGIVNAAGTPEQQATERQREEIAGTMPLKLATLEGNQEYRRTQVGERDKYHTGVIGVRNEANDINQQKADTSANRLVASQRNKGYLPDENNPGAFREMTLEEMQKDPVLSQNRDLILAKTGYQNAQNDLAQARGDVLMNPENPTFLQHERAIQGRLRMAEASLAIQQRRLVNTQSIQGYNSLVNTGFNPLTGEVLGEGDSPVPNYMSRDSSGSPVPYKSASGIPMAARYQSIRAKSIMPLVKTLEDQMHTIEQDGKTGPIAGRWNEFLAGKVGEGDPDYQAFRTNWGLLQTALMQAHVGSKGSEAIMNHFANLVSGNMTPEQANRSLQEIGNYLEHDVAEMVPTPKERPGGGGGSSSKPSASNSNVIEYIRDANGKIVPKKQ